MNRTTGGIYRRLRSARSLGVQRLRRLHRPNPTAFVSPKARIARDVELGDYAFIGPGCSVAPKVSIGAYSMLAAEVAIVGDDHNWQVVGTPSQFAGRPTQRATRIGADVWLGRRVLLMRGITIGDGAVVAAGSVVTKNIPSGEVWAGVPAARIRQRFNSTDELDRHLAQVRSGKVEVSFAGPLGRA